MEFLLFAIGCLIKTQISHWSIQENSSCRNRRPVEDLRTGEVHRLLAGTGPFQLTFPTPGQMGCSPLEAARFVRWPAVLYCVVVISVGEQGFLNPENNKMMR